MRGHVENRTDQATEAALLRDIVYVAFKRKYGGRL